MSLAITIRPETTGDIAVIRRVTERAFAGRWYASGTEQDIIDALRSQGALAVSLVAELVAPVATTVVGHVAFSPVTAEDGTPGWYALGPLSVDPDHQLQGIGRRLVTHGINALTGLGAAGCVVVGDVNYYSRFGFIPTPELAPPDYPRDHVMAMTLGHSSLKSVVSFHLAFNTP